MSGNRPTPEQRREIEARVLLAALKSSMESGDFAGAALAHRELSELLQRKQQEDTFDEGLRAQESDGGVRYDLTGVDEETAGKSDSLAETPPSGKIDPADRASAAAQIIAAIQAEVAAEQAKAQKAKATDSAGADGDLSETQTDDDEEQVAAAADLPGAEEGPFAAAAAGELEGDESQAGDSFKPQDGSSESLTDSDGKPVEERQGTTVAGVDPPGGNFYELFAVDPVSKFELIHTQFLKMVRKLLSERRNRDTSIWQFRDRLRLLCVAHDILRDPVTRTDYDFRLLGLRGDLDKAQIETPEDAPPNSQASRTRLRIGELLQCSEILDQQELEIAVDMHRAMREMPFGQFLVKQEFLTQPELDSALLGQRLIADGKLTVAQFQVAMFSLRLDRVPLGETLVMRGWASQEDVQARMQEDPWAGKFTGALTPPPTEIKIVPGEGEPQRKAPIAASNALPSWAGQLDWGEEEAESEPETVKGDSASDQQRQSKVPGSLIDTSDEKPALSDSDSLYNTHDTVEIDEPPYLAVLDDSFDTIERAEPSASQADDREASGQPAGQTDSQTKPASKDSGAGILEQSTVELDPSELPDFREQLTESLDGDKRAHDGETENADRQVESPDISMPGNGEPKELSSTAYLEQALALELERLERQTLRGVPAAADGSATAGKPEDEPASSSREKKDQSSNDTRVGEVKKRDGQASGAGKSGAQGRGKAQKTREKAADSGYFDNDME